MFSNPLIADGFKARARRLTWTAREYGAEQEFRKRIGGREHLSSPLVLQVQGLATFTGEHYVYAKLTWRKAIGRREAVVADYGCRLQIRRDGEGRGCRCGLVNREPPAGCRGVHDNIARPVSRKLAAEGFNVARHRFSEFVDESATISTDELSLSSSRLVLLDTHCLPTSLVIGNPLDPIRDCHTRRHINDLHTDELGSAVRSRSSGDRAAKLLIRM